MKLKHRFFNWLSSNKFQIADSNEEKTVGTSSPYISAATMGPLTINLGQETTSIVVNTTLQIISANGGTIISIKNGHHSSTPELYIIPEDAEFDTELGKIITMSRLRA